MAIAFVILVESVVLVSVVLVVECNWHFGHMEFLFKFSKKALYHGIKTMTKLSRS